MQICSLCLEIYMVGEAPLSDLQRLIRRDASCALLLQEHDSLCKGP